MTRWRRSLPRCCSSPRPGRAVGTRTRPGGCARRLADTYRAARGGGVGGAQGALRRDCARRRRGDRTGVDRAGAGPKDAQPAGGGDGGGDGGPQRTSGRISRARSTMERAARNWSKLRAWSRPMRASRRRSKPGPRSRMRWRSAGWGEGREGCALGPGRHGAEHAARADGSAAARLPGVCRGWCDPEDLWRSHRGGTLEDLGRRLLGDDYRRFTTTYRERYYGSGHRITAYEGIPDILRWCVEREVPLAIVTSKVAWGATDELAQAGLLQYFPVRDRFRRYRPPQARPPSPSTKRSTASASTSAPPEDVVFVGDGPADVFAARNAGYRRSRRGGARSTPNCCTIRTRTTSRPLRLTRSKSSPRR